MLIGKDEQPLVSIIIPVYNVEKYLPQCLDSVVHQTYHNIEIICVNDGSKDNSIEILNRYEKLDDRVFVINQLNQGVSEARNAGIRHANGKYIMFIDGDDWVDENTCENIVIAALKYDADVVLWSYVREFGERSKEKLMFWEDEAVFDKEAVKNQIHRRLCGLLGEELVHPDYANAIETVWGKLYRADIVLNNRVEFEDLKKIGTGEDAVFNLHVFGYVDKAVYLKVPYYHYRKTNATSLTTSYKSRLFEQWQTLFDMMEQYIKDNGLPREYSDALNNRVALSLLGLGLNIMYADVSCFRKMKMLKKIVTYPRYREAYRKLDYGYFPFHWKVFYGCAKHRISIGIFVLLKIIERIISR